MVVDCFSFSVVHYVLFLEYSHRYHAFLRADAMDQSNGRIEYGVQRKLEVILWVGSFRSFQFRGDSRYLSSSDVVGAQNAGPHH